MLIDERQWRAADTRSGLGDAGDDAGHDERARPGQKRRRQQRRQGGDRRRPPITRPKLPGGIATRTRGLRRFRRNARP